MASLVGQQLKDTYDSLLKTSDNDALGGTYKEITDGSGNGSNLYLGTGGSVGIGVSPSKAFHIKVDTPEFKLEDTSSQNGAGGLISVGNSGDLFLTADPDDVSSGTSNVYLATDGVIRQQVKDSGDISFRDGSANEAFYWDASAGSLGIGTTSPTEKLQIVDSANDVHVRIGSGNAGINPTLRFHGKNTADTTNVYADIRVNPDNQTLGFSGTGTSGGSIEQDALVIDSSGNVGIGTTSPETTLDVNGAITIRNSSYPSPTSGVLKDAFIGSDDGTLKFAINGASNGAYGDMAFLIRKGDSSDPITAMTIDSSGNVLPGADDSQDLGSGTKRFDDVYATNGTIQTSDRNEKQDIEELDDAELRVAQKAKTLLRKYRWKSSVEENENARIHFGIIAQDLEQAFTDEGLDAGRYGMFIKSTWTNEEGEEQTRLGVRYNQLLAFIISAL